jgi:hypothetical protein
MILDNSKIQDSQKIFLDYSNIQDSYKYCYEF